jgi:DNA-binding CsgD family transcriptional regulator
VKIWIETRSHLTRAGLESLLEGIGGVEFADSVEDADAVLSEALNGSTHAPTVLLSDDPLASLDLPAGIRAVLPYESQPRQIVAALQAVSEGLVVVPASAAEQMFEERRNDSLVEPLTDREIKVLEMVAEGLSNKQIAGNLNISEHTAKFHVNSILGKLNAGTRTEAVTHAIRAGILKV